MDGTEAGVRRGRPTVTECDYIEALSAMEGVVKAEALDDATLRDVMRTEASLRTVSGGIRLENSGILDCAAMGSRFVMFCDSRFPRPESVTMEMIDDTGELVGHDVPPGMVHHYRDRTDVFWLSDNFVLYPSKFSSNDVRMVMLSSRLSVPNAPEARVFYPSPSSAMLIGSRFGVDDRMLSAVVVGVDGLAGAQFLGPM